MLWLLYAAASEEENTHSRNLRWLAQMATQIHDRVQNYTNFVRDRAQARQSPVAAAESSRRRAAYSIENFFRRLVRPSANPRAGSI